MLVSATQTSTLQAQLFAGLSHIGQVKINLPKCKLTIFVLPYFSFLFSWFYFEMPKSCFFNKPKTRKIMPSILSWSNYKIITLSLFIWWIWKEPAVVIMVFITPLCMRLWSVMCRLDEWESCMNRGNVTCFQFTLNYLCWENMILTCLAWGYLKFMILTSDTPTRFIFSITLHFIQ